MLNHNNGNYNDPVELCLSETDSCQFMTKLWISVDTLWTTEMLMKSSMLVNGFGYSESYSR